MDVGASYEEFKDVKDALEKLKKEQHHPLRVYNSQKAEDYNRKRVNAKNPTPPVDCQKICYTYYSVRCVHYGEPRSSRGKGLRPNQRSFSKGCQAKVTLSYDRLTKKLVVRESNLKHNHRIGPDVSVHYPSSRKLSEDETTAVNEVLSLQPKTKYVKEMIENKYGKLVTLKDVHNLKTRMKNESRGGHRDAQLLLEELDNSLKKDSSSCGGVVVNEKDTLEVLFYQSGLMKRLFQKFPEILLVDATYNVNGVGMPLYCLMIEDGFGHGRVVQYAVTTEEDISHIRKIIQSFKEDNPAWSSVRVIVVDKDFTEWKVLKEEFPEATVLFCQWHVMKAMFKKMVECDVEKSERDEVRELIRQLVYSKDADDYYDTKQEMYSKTNEQFRQYFESNWDGCQEMWVTYKRDHHVHLGNTTNNRLESHNQKLKDLTQRSSNLTEMFQNVLRFSNTSASEYSHSVFTEEFTTCTFPDKGLEGAQEIRSVCTQYAADTIIAQLKLAHSITYEISTDDVEQYTLTSTGSNVHEVKLKENLCSCSFRRNMLMPCRHLFAVRLSLNIPIFKEEMVAVRWIKSYQSVDMFDQSTSANSDCDPDPSTEHEDKVRVSTLSTRNKLLGTLARNQKFRKMQSLGHKLATIASECGMPQFREKCAQVDKLIDLWEKNIPAVVCAACDHQPSSENEHIIISGCHNHGEEQMTITVPPCVQEQVVETDSEMVLSQSHEGEQMTIADTDHVPPHNQSEVIAEEKLMSSQDNDQMKITETDPLSSHTQEDNFVFTEEKLTSTQVTTTETDTLQPQKEIASGHVHVASPACASARQEVTSNNAVQSEKTGQSHTEDDPTRLKLSVLKYDMKIKPHIKARGRPKHSGTLWPSKSSKNRKRKQQVEKENIPPTKKPCVDKKVSVTKKRVGGPGDPAYLVKMRKKQSVKESQDVVEIDHDECQLKSVDDMPSPEFTINGQDIFIDDIETLKSDHRWLGEKLINAGQRMLLEKFPGTAGLYDTCFSDTLAYPCEPHSDLVQVLNLCHTHWVCVSCKDCKPGTIKVYDSQRSGDLPLSAKDVIAALVKCDKKKIFLLFPDVQQQPDSSSCGLFALAYASTLCEGKDPTKVRYDFPRMRAHFLHCLEQKKFIPFPSSTTLFHPAKPIMTSFRIYCVCRLPDRGDKMVCCDKCREWYHFICLGLDLQTEIGGTWLCCSCNN